MKEIIEKIKAFRNERNWEIFHTPENLAKSIAIESAELLEHFQWDGVEVNKSGVEEELADVLIYCFLLADHYDFDITDIMERKIKKNAQKYPVKEAYGNAKKYTELRKDKNHGN